MAAKTTDREGLAGTLEGRCEGCGPQEQARGATRVRREPWEYGSTNEPIEEVIRDNRNVV